MARKKKRGRKMPAWKRYAKAGIRVIGTAVGIGVATSPLHQGLTTLAGGNFQHGFDQMIHDTTGLSVGGTGSFDVSKVVQTGLVVAVGIGFMSLFKYLARRV